MTFVLAVIPCQRAKVAINSVCWVATLCHKSLVGGIIKYVAVVDENLELVRTHTWFGTFWHFNNTLIFLMQRRVVVLKFHVIDQWF